MMKGFFQVVLKVKHDHFLYVKSTDTMLRLIRPSPVTSMESISRLHFSSYTSSKLAAPGLRSNKSIRERSLRNKDLCHPLISQLHGISRYLIQSNTSQQTDPQCHIISSSAFGSSHKRLFSIDRGGNKRKYVEENKDPTEYFNELQKRAKDGDETACLEIGFFLDKHGKNKNDYKIGAEYVYSLYRKLQNDGERMNIEIPYLLGKLYHKIDTLTEREEEDEGILDIEEETKEILYERNSATPSPNKEKLTKDKKSSNKKQGIQYIKVVRAKANQEKKDIEQKKKMNVSLSMEPFDEGTKNIDDENFSDEVQRKRKEVNISYAHLPFTSMKAFSFFVEAAEMGHIGAMTETANILLSIDSEKVKDNSQFLSYIQYAMYLYAVLGNESNRHGEALFQLGLLHYNGVKVPINENVRGDGSNDSLTSSTTISTKITEGKTAAIGEIVLIQQNPIKAGACFHQAAKYGDTSAIYFLGHAYRVGDVRCNIHEPDEEISMKYLLKACDQNHPKANYYVALLCRPWSDTENIMNQSVSTLTKEEEKKLDLFHVYLTRAIELKDDEALFCQADCFFHGSDGFEKNITKAIEYYIMAAYEGNSDAMCCLGAIAFAREDYEMAFQYYQSAGELGNEKGWLNVASMYSLGQGVPKNEAMAKHILKTVVKK